MSPIDHAPASAEEALAFANRDVLSTAREVRDAVERYQTAEKRRQFWASRVAAKGTEARA